MEKILKKQKHTYRKFKIIEYWTSNNHYYEVAYGLFRTHEKIETMEIAKGVIDYCYFQAELKKNKRKAKK